MFNLLISSRGSYCSSSWFKDGPLVQKLINSCVRLTTDIQGIKKRNKKKNEQMSDCPTVLWPSSKHIIGLVPSKSIVTFLSFWISGLLRVFRLFRCQVSYPVTIILKILKIRCLLNQKNISSKSTMEHISNQVSFFWISPFRPFIQVYCTYRCLQEKFLKDKKFYIQEEKKKKS